MQENKPFLVVGLGNPGSGYANTRHNVGFMAVDYLAGAGATWKNEKDALTVRVDIDGRRVIFVKPQTFMNNSGVAVGALMTFYKVEPKGVALMPLVMRLSTAQRTGLK